MLPPQLRTCKVLCRRCGTDVHTSERMVWCPQRAQRCSRPPGSPLQGPLSARSVLPNSAWPPWLGSPGGQSPLQGKRQPLVAGASTWGVGSNEGAEEGPQGEHPGVFAAKPISEPGRGDQTGLKLQPSAPSSPPQKPPCFHSNFCSSYCLQHAGDNKPHHQW